MAVAAGVVVTTAVGVVVEIITATMIAMASTVDPAALAALSAAQVVAAAEAGVVAAKGVSPPLGSVLVAAVALRIPIMRRITPRHARLVAVVSLVLNLSLAAPLASVTPDGNSRSMVM